MAVRRGPDRVVLSRTSRMQNAKCKMPTPPSPHPSPHPSLHVSLHISLHISLHTLHLPLRTSSWHVPSADEFQLNLRLARRCIESGLTHARRGRRAVRVEQLENAALTRFIADTRDPLDIRRRRHGGRSIPIGGRAPLERRAAPPGNVASNADAHCLEPRSGLRLARLCPRALGAAV